MVAGLFEPTPLTLRHRDRSYNRGMRRTAILLGLTLLTATPALSQSIAEMLTSLADVPWSEMDRVQKRFEYLLPRFIEPCSDIDADKTAGDMIYRTFEVIEDAGVKADLLELFEGMYGIARLSHQVLGGPAPCLQYLAVYAAGRSEGLSHDESTEGIKAIINLAR